MAEYLELKNAVAFFSDNQLFMNNFMEMIEAETDGQMKGLGEHVVHYLPDFLYKLLLCYDKVNSSGEGDWFRMACIIWREYRVAGYTDKEDNLSETWLPFLFNPIEIAD